MRTVAVLDQDIDAGQVAEQALDFLAEDKQGNVWYLGSYTEAYEGGQFVNAADALAGRRERRRGRDHDAGEAADRDVPYVQAKVPGDDPDVAEVAQDRQCETAFRSSATGTCSSSRRADRAASTSTSRPASAASGPSPATRAASRRSRS